MIEEPERSHDLRLQAQAFLGLRDYAEAEARITATLEIYRAASGPQYVNYPTAQMVQGMIYGQTGRIAEAEQLLRDAVRIRAENAPETHFLRATARCARRVFDHVSSLSRSGIVPARQL